MSSDNLKLCSTHKKMRLERFLVPRNVFDADGKIVDVKYNCMPESQCTNIAPGFQAPVAAAAKAQGDAAPASRSAAVDNMSTAMKMYGGETRGRYYDLANQSGGIDNTTKKVCFACGGDDHERPECPNQFCRMCRGIIPPGGNSRHVCESSELSDLIDMRTPTPEELAGVRCSVCNQYGHMDCAVLAKPANFRVSCCCCGDVGHHGFQCPNAPNDRWLGTQLRWLGQALERRRAQPLPDFDYSAVGSASGVAPSPSKGGSTKAGGKRRQKRSSKPDSDGAPSPPAAKAHHAESQKQKTSAASELPPPPLPTSGRSKKAEGGEPAGPSSSSKGAQIFAF